jgi:hypothetical protein
MPKKKTAPKKTTKRSQSQYPNLEPRLNSRVRQELIDYDYLDQLGPEELAWLNKFSGEYINSSFKRDGTDLHKTTVQRREAYKRNNDRNNDMYGIVRNKVANTHLLNYEENISLFETKDDTTPIESSYVEYIDGLQLKEIMKEYADAMSTYSENFE